MQEIMKLTTSSKFICMVASIAILAVSVITYAEWWSAKAVSATQLFGFCGMVITVTILTEIILLLRQCSE